MTGHDTEFSDDFFITAYAVCAPVAGTPADSIIRHGQLLQQRRHCRRGAAGWVGHLFAYHPVEGANPTWWEVDEMVVRCRARVACARSCPAAARGASLGRFRAQFGLAPLARCRPERGEGSVTRGQPQDGNLVVPPKDDTTSQTGGI